MLELEHTSNNADEQVDVKLVHIIKKKSAIFKDVAILMGSSFSQLTALQRIVLKRYTCLGIKLE